MLNSVSDIPWHPLPGCRKGGGGGGAGNFTDFLCKQQSVREEIGKIRNKGKRSKEFFKNSIYN